MLKDNLFPVFLCILATPVFCAGYPLNQTCSPPPSQNGLGYCGPAFCENVVNNLPGCVFTSKAQDYPAQVAKTGTKSCVQSTDPRCSSAALKALFIGQGVKAAYCNDAFLVILSDGSSGFANYLSSIKNPPASTTESGGNCVTRYTNPVFMTTKIPLFPTLLSTADRNINNKNTKSFPNGQCDRDGCYMGEKGDTYPLPTRGAVGVSIGGQEIYPVYNNVGYLAPQKCEVDTCNEHVGGGGGQPHLHGDPFGSWCLYSAANYSSPYAHPPQIGWAFDGPSIYGRHLSPSNAGYYVDLDQCGGHAHGSLDYHYHAQVLTAVSDQGVVPGQSQGVSYYASTTGPYQCLKGDISLVKNYWGMGVTSYTSEVPDTTKFMCTGTTNYYQASGITLPNTVGMTPTPAPSSVPSDLPTAVPSGPTHAPTFPPTSMPSFMPSSAPSAKPTFSPTSAPTASPTSPLTTYQVQQVVEGVVLTSASRTALFTTAFQNSVAGILGIQPSAVVIVFIKITSTRRLMDVEEHLQDVGNHHRPFLEASGIAVSYTVTIMGSTAAAVAGTISSNASELNAALVAAGFVGASVQTAFVNTSAPSAAPISASCVTKSNLYLTFSVVSATYFWMCL